MATKKINTRIQNKLDTFDRWSSSQVSLLPGEIAFVQVTEAKKDSTTGNIVQVPAILMKIGEADANGNPKTFNALPWLSAKAADVYGWAKTEKAEDVNISLTINKGTSQKTLGTWLTTTLEETNRQQDSLAECEAAVAGNTATLAKISTDITNMTCESPEPDNQTSATSFIDTINQNNGVISATKRTIPSATTTTAGIVQLDVKGGACSYEAFCDFASDFEGDLLSTLTAIEADYLRVADNKLYMGRTGTDEIIFDCGNATDI